MITDFEFTKVFSLLITLKAVFYTNIILFRCNSNEDCTKDTCCRKDSLSGIGKCVLKPHKLGHACDDQCPCTGSFSCKNIEVVKDNKKMSVEKQCATDNKKIMAEFVKKLKNAKKSIDPKKSKQTQT